jgi:hypothetical protein
MDNDSITPPHRGARSPPGLRTPDSGRRTPDYKNSHILYPAALIPAWCAQAMPPKTVNRDWRAPPQRRDRVHLAPGRYPTKNRLEFLATVQIGSLRDRSVIMQDSFSPVSRDPTADRSLPGPGPALRTPSPSTGRRSTRSRTPIRASRRPGTGTAPCPSARGAPARSRIGSASGERCEWHFGQMSMACALRLVPRHARARLPGPMANAITRA